MAIEYMKSLTAGQSTISLILDVVHTPKIVSELEKHDPQILDESAHYHFFTPAGVSVDAAKFVEFVQQQGQTITGMHTAGKLVAGHMLNCIQGTGS